MGEIIAWLKANYRSSSNDNKVPFGKVWIKLDRNPRYACFLKHGTDCLVCGLRGEYFALERQLTSGPGSNDITELIQGPKQDKRLWYHFNLYGRQDNAEILLTVDHIKARCLGGTSELSNLQTLCNTCNNKKSVSDQREMLRRSGVLK